MTRLVRKITFKRGEVVFIYQRGQVLANNMQIHDLREFNEGVTYGIEIYVNNSEGEYVLWQRIMNCELHIEFDYEEILRD